LLINLRKLYTEEGGMYYSSGFFSDIPTACIYELKRQKPPELASLRRTSEKELGCCIPPSFSTKFMNYMG
jgi:hypothetical protein